MCDIFLYIVHLGHPAPPTPSAVLAHRWSSQYICGIHTSLVPTSFSAAHSFRVTLGQFEEMQTHVMLSPNEAQLAW